jgi:muconolactone delta-isomerase
MQFIALTRRLVEKFEERDFEPIQEAESQRIRALYTEGFIRQIWRRGDIKGACILIEANSEAEVLEKLNTLPLAQAGMLEFIHIVPLSPYHGFAPIPTR